MKINNILLMGVLCMLVVYTGCESKKEHHEATGKFVVTSPMRMDTLTTRNYVCQIHSVQHIELRALERGYLEKIFVDEGQFIKKGQLMFQILPRLYQAELKKAEAEAHFAEIEYQNTKRLAESNVVAPNELALAEAKYDKAKAELSLAQVHLDFTQVRAPFDGIMDHFHVRLGSLVEEGELLTTLSDNHEMWVYFNVPEAEYLDYQSKVTKDSVINVRLLMANNKMFDYPGKVTAIEADFNNETGNIAFRATFPNPKGLLRHGETGSILV
ncbi:MAG: efflux RND transporter periplasmic adaptor subunit, partial [Cyclobacteriaceae bacterium]